MRVKICMALERRANPYHLNSGRRVGLKNQNVFDETIDIIKINTKNAKELKALLWLNCLFLTFLMKMNCFG